MRAWKKELSKLQYRVLRKATGAVQETAADKVNWMARVEDVNTHMDNKQARFVARCVEDPSKLGDIMPVGFGDDNMLDDELAEEEDGRAWNDHGPQWVGKEGKKDRFVSTLTSAVSILPEGKPLWGGPCQRIEIKEVDVRPTGGRGIRSGQHPEDPEAWEKEIGKAGIGSAYVFSDGSLLGNDNDNDNGNGGNVGGGTFVVGAGGEESDVKCGIGNVATVWDGKIAGMAGGLAKMRYERKILILADSQAAIAAVRKAGRTGKARSRNLQRVVYKIAENGVVMIGWVKAHMAFLATRLQMS